jgi:hypothetical protein
VSEGSTAVYTLLQNLAMTWKEKKKKKKEKKNGHSWRAYWYP